MAEHIVFEKRSEYEARRDREARSEFFIEMVKLTPIVLLIVGLALIINKISFPIGFFLVIIGGVFSLFYFKKTKRYITRLLLIS